MSRIPHSSWLRIATLAALAAAPSLAWAQSGEFTFVTGEVSVTKANGQRLTPAKGTKLDVGDIVATGANGMAQITMVDQARLSLRPRTQFTVEQYPDKPDSAQTAIVSLLRGTLRTFTGLIASANRDRFVMKTRVATVGIRGSGNILYACDGSDCDPAVASELGVREGPVTVSHTIDGAHAVTNFRSDVPAGTPAQQGGATTIVTGPGQTALVQANLAPRYVPTPSFIARAAIDMTGAAEGNVTGATRDFSPGDLPALEGLYLSFAPVTPNVGSFFPLIDATSNLDFDPIGLHDAIITIGSPFFGQSTQLDMAGGAFRGYRGYPSTEIDPAITGGTLRDATTVDLGDARVTMGRWDGASVALAGPGSAVAVPGSVHWIVGPSGYPPYLSEVLTGTATYTLAASTSPTNQHGTTGTLSSATINANFTARTLDLAMTVTMPAAGSVPGGQWQLSAGNVPITLNTFFATTAGGLTIGNGTHTSGTNPNLTGSVEGSFVGSRLAGIILGYGIFDRTAPSSAGHHSISGVAALRGPPQNAAAPYREGRVSDPSGTLNDFVRTYTTTNRPEEVTSDAEGRATAFAAPFAGLGGHAAYSLGTAQVVQSGFDPETGMIWGRWSGGTAQVSGRGQTQSLNLANASLHYIFAGAQSGPVSLPLTGTGTYDVIGSTSPTDSAGHVGALNSATLNANFTSRTVDASVNIGINGRTWTGTANGMPIYRDQYFSAHTGSRIGGLPNPAPLFIGCTPSCGQGAQGSFDGFFTGRTGQRAGMMYNLGGNQGAVAFGRRGG